jgi:O-antigen/teichoic acid export membrane protein
MNWFNKHLSFKADLFVTLLNSLVVIGGVFILNGLIARIHGLEVLGEFLLVKRTLTAVVGILLIGMNVGLPNYLSRNFERSYGDSAIIIFIVITIPLTLLLIAGILWLNISGFYSDYFWLYIIFTLGICSQFITYGLYRGYMNMIGANFFQLVGTAIIPIIVFTMVADLYDGLYFMGSGVFIIMLFAYLMRNKGIHFHEINYYQIIKIIKYGLVRIPSFIAQFILLAGIPIYLAQAVSFESVAYFSSSLSLVRLSLLIVNPIAMVLLPRISNKIAGGLKEDVAPIFNILLKAGIVFSVIGTTYCYIYAPFILQTWLGEVSDAGINILRLAILALPFYTFSGLTRSPIDAISEKGYNSLIYGVAAISMIAIIYIGNYLGYDLITTALISFVISHIIAALGGALIIKKLYNYQLWNFELSRDIISSIIIMFAIHQLFSLLHFSAKLEFFTTSAAYATVGILIFKYVKTGWLADLKSKIYA